MKKLLLGLLVIAPFLMVAQNIKKEKAKTSFLSYPSVDVSKIDVNTVQASFCAGNIKYLSKSVKKTAGACKAKGGKAQAMEIYQYQIMTLEPASYLKIADASGVTQHMDKTSDGGKGSVTFGKEKCYITEGILASAYKKEKANFESKSQKEHAKNSLKAAKDFLNNALFFTYVPESMEVYYVKSKNMDYSDLEKAANIAKEGYEAIKGNAEDKDAQSRLRQAIAIWEKAMAESTPDNKNSRINKKVTLHLAENLGHAHMYLFEYDKAMKVVADALKLEKNVTTNGTTRRKALLNTIRMNKKGYERNKEVPINNNTAKISISIAPASEWTKFKEEYSKYGHAEMAEDMAAAQEEHDKGVASGEINPYQQYVVVAAGGNVLTLPDLGAKLMKAPAGEKLDKFPEEVLELDVANLILRGNNLTSIPPSIGKMTGLKKLNLANNKLTSLPEEMGQLSNLKSLVLKGNNIPASEVSKIQKLLPNCKIKL